MIDTISNNPVRWAEKVAGSKPRVSLFVLMHCLGAAGVFCIYWLLAPYLHQYPIVSLGPAIILLGIAVVYPAMYLYAVYRLLKVLKDKKDGFHNKRVQPIAEKSGSG